MFLSTRLKRGTGSWLIQFSSFAISFQTTYCKLLDKSCMQCKRIFTELTALLVKSVWVEREAIATACSKAAAALPPLSSMMWQVLCSILVSKVPGSPPRRSHPVRASRSWGAKQQWCKNLIATLEHAPVVFWCLLGFPICKFSKMVAKLISTSSSQIRPYLNPLPGAVPVGSPALSNPLQHFSSSVKIAKISEAEAPPKGSLRWIFCWRKPETRIMSMIYSALVHDHQIKSNKLSQNSFLLPKVKISWSVASLSSQQKRLFIIGMLGIL